MGQHKIEKNVLENHINTGRENFYGGELKRNHEDFLTRGNKLKKMIRFPCE
jgi:hypothetical protein